MPDNRGSGNRRVRPTYEPVRESEAVSRAQIKAAIKAAPRDEYPIPREERRAMNVEPFKIDRAIIGWSNRETGCEVYEDTLPEWPRWLPRSRGEGVGRLYTDAIGDPEGARALVLLFPRQTTDEQMQAAEEAVRRVFDA